MQFPHASKGRTTVVVLTVGFASLLGSCSENLISPRRDDQGLAPGRTPLLQRGDGTAPVAVGGGSVPTIPNELRLGKSLSLQPFGTAKSQVSALALTAQVTHVLLENQSTGARVLWAILGGAIVNSASLGTVPVSWRIVGAGDFNSDGLEDILWDNTGVDGNGSRAVWLMNGNGGVIAAISLGIVPMEWHMAGAGDYDGDGKDDILWENLANGSRAIWLMNGGSVLRSVVIGTLFDWHMVAARDLNSDGKADILLENLTNGNKVLWMMSGGGVIGNVLLGTLPLEWKLSGTSDIDGDSRNDIILENTSTGARAVWIENGFGGVLAAPLLTFLDPVWHMATALVPDRAVLGKPNLTVDGMYLAQSVQTYGGTIPMIKNRDAFLRVFLKADRANLITGQVRIRIYSNGTLIQTMTFSAGSASVPIAIDQSDGVSSVNVKILGGSIQPGLAILADVDPSNAVAESNEADNQFPVSGIPMMIDVRETPPLKIMLVPVLQSSTGLQGNITLANGAAFLNFATKIHPIAGYDAYVHGVYASSSAALDPTISTWSPLLSEINALRVAEGFPDYNYYGVVAVPYFSGIVGLANAPGKAGIGVDWPTIGATTFAHEIGHNWGRFHSPCGGPSGIDPNYPYYDGSIGAYGVDVQGGVIKFPGNFDVMSYCDPYWISDYTYRGIMDYRATTSLPSVISPRLRETFDKPATVTSSRSLGDYRNSRATGTTVSSLAAMRDISAGPSAGAERCTIVWGRVTASGLVLEPSFEAITIPRLPSTPGKYRINALGDAGSSLLSFSFKPDTVPDATDGTQIFAFAVPTRTLEPARIRSLRLSGEGRSVEFGATPEAVALPAGATAVTVTPSTAGSSELRWNQRAFPLLVVRDTRTGGILTLARGGVARVAAPPSALEIHTSDRIHTRVNPVERQ